MFTKYDTNGNAVFTYSEEVDGWFYDVEWSAPLGRGDKFPLIISEDGISFTCYSDYSGSTKVDWFEIA